MAFTDTLRRWLESTADKRDAEIQRKVLTPVFDRLSSLALNSAGLVISAGGATTAKTGGSDCYAVVNGVLVKVAASTTLPALTGINMTAAYFNVACFFVDSAGNLTVLGGTQGATLAGVVFPQFTTQKALLGFLLITYSGAFTGGTTPLDTATTVYINTPFGFDPACLVGPTG
jgi:hypothetical protein